MEVLSGDPYDVPEVDNECATCCMAHWCHMCCWLTRPDIQLPGVNIEHHRQAVHVNYKEPLHYEQPKCSHLRRFNAIPPTSSTRSFFACRNKKSTGLQRRSNFNSPGHFLKPDWIREYLTSQRAWSAIPRPYKMSFSIYSDG
ncbi:hypothetical protein NPIL_418281 [Nephila pilipes]|uniref:Uncharacterized protein n=1 Tax=Nephila pilipes TaxID=299642 RepID=A0A8X6PWK4_NEPPI|nr:hypothetical protein NPIL_418281 [Nephila pilipes]